MSDDKKGAELLGAREIAAATGLAMGTIRTYAQDGVIPKIKTPKGRIVYDLAAVKDALANRPRKTRRAARQGSKPGAHKAAQRLTAEADPIVHVRLSDIMAISQAVTRMLAQAVTSEAERQG